jgi:hypothetical protein
MIWNRGENNPIVSVSDAKQRVEKPVQLATSTVLIITDSDLVFTDNNKKFVQST